MSLPTVSPRLIGGRYDVERELGRGATATVYLAQDRQTQNLIAVKVLRSELAESVGADRFLREIRVTLDLTHPGILPVLDSGADDTLLYCVLPYMEGGTLRDRLFRDKQLPIGEAVAITRTIANALAYAHGRGLVHRDIKPENILFGGGAAHLGDFGIARLLHATAGEMTTTTGIVRGTPMYMSPEQASGERHYDGRSDIYSLASVFYEMVSGMPPFIGPTSQSVLAQRFTNRPPRMSVYRATVSPELQQVVERAMMTSPADRYGSAAEFASELETAHAASPTLTAQRVRARQSVSRVPRIAAGLMTAGLIAAGAWAVRGRAGESAPADVQPDTTQLAILPFEREGNTDRLGSIDAFIYDAFSAWHGVTVLEPFRIRDAIQRARARSDTIDYPAVARALGAGRYVRGSVSPAADGSWRVRAWMYDVGGEAELMHSGVNIPADLRGIDVLYAKLADSLLLRGKSDNSVGGRVPSTRNLTAMQSFASAFAALDDWDFGRADSLFDRAISADANYARAYMWQAQVRAWQANETSAWAPLVDRALRDSIRLTDREKQLAHALQAMSTGAFDRACGLYGDLRNQNALDFTAWYGLGQCRDRDLQVVPDATSPSTWRYRASYQQALTAYQRAFELLPLSHRSFQRGAYQPLRDLLFLRPSQLRRAVAADPGVNLLGRLDRDGDTLIMRPYLMDAVMGGDTSAVPKGIRSAIALQQQRFHRIAAGWSTSLPRSAGAKEAVAVSLEMRGDHAALDTLRVARGLATDADQRLRLAAAEVILRLKFVEPDDVTEATAIRRLADSLLTANRRPAPAESQVLAALAALTGRCGMAGDLANRAAIPSPDIPLPRDLIGAAYDLATRIALGCAGDAARSLVDIRRRVAAADGGDLPTVEPSLIGRAVRVMYPLDSVQIVASLGRGDYLIRGQSAALRRDTAGARMSIDRVSASRELTGYDAVQPEAIYAEARLLLMVHDTASAATTLDRLLDRRHFSTPGMLSEAIPMAMLLRAMALRAEIAAARRESALPARWGVLVATLWSGADPELAVAARRLSRLSRAR